MNSSLLHRGPDDEGFFVEGSIGLGNRRLSIIDLRRGKQPIFNEEKSIVITFNGEIYNYPELRQELIRRGHHFYTDSDTEVIVHLYEDDDVHCLDKLNGMFAFALWDLRKNRLFLARDRLGIKPLYYYLDGEKLVFASEIKAILVDESIERKIDPKGLINYFTFGHSVAPVTIYQGIKKLLPGHYLLYEDGRVVIEQYWDVPLDTTQEDRGEAYYKAKVLELLSRSVQRRMIADVPIGALLSGGIDSSAVVALMSRVSDRPVQTFSVGFEFGETYNELDDARIVARHFRTDHHELLLKDRDLVQVLQKLVYHYDEPFGDPAAFPTYLVSEFARQYVKVTLTGEGGDEIFGGYRRYSIERFASYYQILPTFLRDNFIQKFVGCLPRLRRLKKTLNTLSITNPPIRYGSWLTVFSDEMKWQLFNAQLTAILEGLDAFEVYKRYYQRASGKPLLDKVMYVDQKTWLPDTYLEKVDKASMAVSLETRVPFLDHELVEFTAAIPAKYKIRGFKTKYILKQAMKGILPESTLHKPKHGFAVPTDPWFRGKLKDFVWEVLFDPKTRSRGYFNFNYIKKLYKAHEQGKEVYDKHLWLLLVFELWHRRFLDRRA
jgi:asparagine synthase (glutamine-hydrolysing)